MVGLENLTPSLRSGPQADRYGLEGFAVRARSGCRRYGNQRLAETRAHGVLGAPASAVGRDDNTRAESAEVVEDLRDERLEQPGR
jgi:hypothetical protein